MELLTNLLERELDRRHELVEHCWLIVPCILVVRAHDTVPHGSKVYALLDLLAYHEHATLSSLPRSRSLGCLSKRPLSARGLRDILTAMMPAGSYWP